MLFALGLLFAGIGFLEFKPAFDMYTYIASHPSEYCSSDPIIEPEGQGACVANLLAGERDSMIEGVLFGAVFNIPYLVAWIATLVNLARLREMTWFVLIFLFGSIGVLVYLFAGPSPIRGQPAPAAPAMQGPSPHLASALGILQERYARGEIDAPTFAAMSEQLRASERPQE